MRRAALTPLFFLIATAAMASAACGGSPSSTIPDAVDETATESESDPSNAPGKADGKKAPPGAPTNPETPLDPPAKTRLTCLGKHYIGWAATKGSSWNLALPDYTELQWDDGTTKTYDQKLAAPDLEDTLSMKYTTGPIVPVTTPNQDAGRIRSDALFKATFGATEAAVKAKLVDVDFVGQNVKFHERGAAALGKVSAKLTQLVAKTPSLGAFVKGDLGGTFSWRPIANTNRLSAHSYGIAIDIVVARSDYWEWEKKSDGSFTWKNEIPQAIVDAFEAEGFIWGGRWHHFDTMHFEYRPELFDNSCL